jgi:hypothetical protein
MTIKTETFSSYIEYLDRMKANESSSTEVNVQRDSLHDDIVKLQLDLELPKNVFEFITWYCYLANIEPSRFIYSLIIHSLSELIYETRWDDESAFSDIGVR